MGDRGDAIATVVILGAGAIGRGYLPWVLSPEYRLFFVDSNTAIIDAMRR